MAKSKNRKTLDGRDIDACGPWLAPWAKAQGRLNHPKAGLKVLCSADAADDGFEMTQASMIDSTVDDLDRVHQTLGSARIG